MNKFELRNLKNERRRLEKQLEKIDRKIDKAENAEVILKTTMEITHCAKVKETILHLSKKKFSNSRVFDVEFTRYKNEVTCTYKTKGGKQYVGVAKCAYDDEFDISVGLSLSETKAIIEIYNDIIGEF